ncbi:hypothetical protein FRC07_008246 [Ceratobasidium sp. 392]|nr:hypothetical protein FRC07_008246 [Ceratobasidium sp. 392]
MYQNGIGVPDNVRGKNEQRLAAIAIATKIREVYSFLSKNYIEGDQIYLLGFSLGAFIAYKVAFLIETMGLLEIEDMKDFFQRWANLTDHQASLKLGRDVEIEFLGVWDMVAPILHQPTTQLERLLGTKDME